MFFHCSLPVVIDKVTYYITLSIQKLPKFKYRETFATHVFSFTAFIKNHYGTIVPFIKTNDTKKVRIIVCFRGLKKSRILIGYPWFF